MKTDFDEFQRAIGGGEPAASGGLEGVESMLDYIERSREVERRAQEVLGPTWADQVSQLLRDPVVQETAAKIWHGQGAETGNSQATNAQMEVSPNQSRASGVAAGRGDDGVTPGVTDSSEGGVMSGGIEWNIPRNMTVFTHPELPDAEDLQEDFAGYTVENREGDTEAVQEVLYGATPSGEFHIIFVGSTVVYSQDVRGFARQMQEGWREMREKVIQAMGDTKTDRARAFLRHQDSHTMNMREIADFVGLTHQYVRNLSAQMDPKEVSQ